MACFTLDFLVGDVELCLFRLVQSATEPGFICVVANDTNFGGLVVASIYWGQYPKLAAAACGA